MDGQPLTNWSAAPVLFDLHQDCGETIPRTPCPWDGKWPAHFSGVGSSSWHSGCMPAAEYKTVVAELVALYHEHVASFPRVESQVQKGLSPERFPCCNAGCSPLPACCHCKSEAEAQLAAHLGI